MWIPTPPWAATALRSHEGFVWKVDGEGTSSHWGTIVISCLASQREQEQGNIQIWTGSFPYSLIMYLWEGDICDLDTATRQARLGLLPWGEDTSKRCPSLYRHNQPRTATPPGMLECSIWLNPMIERREKTLIDFDWDAPLNPFFPISKLSCLPFLAGIM